MTTQTLGSKPPETSDSSPESGVIRDARRHRCHERTAALLLVLGLIAAALFLVSEGNGGQISRASSPRPTWMAGAPLRKPTHLRLIVSGNTPRVSIVDVDSGRVQAVRGLGLPRQRYTLRGPQLWSLTPAPGGALAVVWRQNCRHCYTLTSFRIGADGLARRTTSVMVARHQQSTQALGSTTASWVLTRPRSGRCTLALAPDSRPVVAVPCGTLGADTAAGMAIERRGEVRLVDPRTGRVRERVAVGDGGQLDFLGHDMALIGTSFGDSSGGAPDRLALVNLSTGARTHLRWPSILQFGYSVIPDPHGPLVAVNFGDPADPGPQPGQRCMAPGPTYRQVHTRTRVPNLRGPQVLRRRVDRGWPSGPGRPGTRPHRARRLSPRRCPAPSRPGATPQRLLRDGPAEPIAARPRPRGVAGVHETAAELPRGQPRRDCRSGQRSAQQSDRRVERLTRVSVVRGTRCLDHAVEAAERLLLLAGLVGLGRTDRPRSAHRRESVGLTANTKRGKGS